MWIENIILFIIGFASGGAIASGIFALIVKLGVVTRLAAFTKTTTDMKKYENCIWLGGVAGNLITIFSFPLPIGVVGQAVLGLFFGIYVGCFYMALAESLHSLPILNRRMNIKKGTGAISFSMAVGKTLGSFFYFFTRVS